MRSTCSHYRQLDNRRIDIDKMRSPSSLKPTKPPSELTISSFWRSSLAFSAFKRASSSFLCCLFDFFWSEVSFPMVKAYSSSWATAASTSARSLLISPLRASSRDRFSPSCRSFFRARASFRIVDSRRTDGTLRGKDAIRAPPLHNYYERLRVMTRTLGSKRLRAVSRGRAPTVLQI